MVKEVLSSPKKKSLKKPKAQYEHLEEGNFKIEGKEPSGNAEDIRSRFDTP